MTNSLALDPNPLTQSPNSKLQHAKRKTSRPQPEEERLRWELNSDAVAWLQMIDDQLALEEVVASFHPSPGVFGFESIATVCTSTTMCYS